MSRRSTQGRWVGSVVLAATLALAASVRAAETGDELYRSGHYERAMAWWKQAAAEGNAHAAYRLGVAYADGAVVPQDYQEAYQWYELAARAGDREAQFDLGTLHDNGWGVPQSTRLAAKWYREAALRGHAACQYNLATMYERGEGVEKDLVRAYKWYFLAAQQGFIGTRYGSLDELAGKMSDLEIKKGVDLALGFEPIE
jgi:TPR repeat protein